MIQVLVADDHLVVRTGLKQVLLLMGDAALAGEAASGREVLDILRHGRNFDLLLLDLSMPDLSGVELVTAILKADTSVPILIFTMHCELQIAKRVLQAGASGFVTKGCPHEILVSAIRKVAAGGRFVDPLLAEKMMFKTAAEEKEMPHDNLSPRELHIMKLLAQGKSGNEIAKQLSISKKTVSTHKTRLMQKMNFPSIAELVRYVVEYALLDEQEESY